MAVYKNELNKLDILWGFSTVYIMCIIIMLFLLVVLEGYKIFDSGLEMGIIILDYLLLITMPVTLSHFTNLHNSPYKIRRKKDGLIFYLRNGSVVTVRIKEVKDFRDNAYLCAFKTRVFYVYDRNNKIYWHSCYVSKDTIATMMNDFAIYDGRKAIFTKYYSPDLRNFDFKRD